MDFAYSIHTDVGNQCTGAKVNRNIVPLRYQLQNGDMVEIITRPSHHPAGLAEVRRYLQAISKIQLINAEEKNRSLVLGKDLLEKEFKRNNLKFSSYLKSDEIRKLLKDYSLLTLDDLISQVGCGRISPRQVVNHFVVQEAPKEAEKPSEKEKKKPAAAPSLGISLTGIDDVMVRFAKCCNPIPGDEITGYISHGRGITVHTQNCPHLQKLDIERIVEVNWDLRQKNAYPVHIKVVCTDRKGVLTEVSSVITSLDVNISYAQIETTDMIANCIFIIDVYDTRQLNAVFSAIRQLKIVRSIERIRKA